jgi:hypothetical protein
VTLSEKRATWEFVNCDRHAQVAINTDGASHDELCMSYVVVADQGTEFEEETSGLAGIRHLPLFKSDWFAARSPQDLWDYLIDGEIYDPRPSRVGGGRFRCQQCGLAWWSYLQGMHTSTGLSLFRLLAREVAWSVRADLLVRGEWVHGMWNEPPETHLRFLLDGVLLMVFEGETSGEDGWIVDASTTMHDVIQRYTDSLDNGNLWFLHDSLEINNAGASVKNDVLGATRGNTLCLNTHVQALTVLNRLRNRAELSHREALESAYQQGLAALQSILALRPAERLYKLLGKCVMPAVTSKKRPGFSARLGRALFFRVLRRPYWWVRRTHPRIVYPNGFIERDMNSSMLADDYHVLNLKDLLVLYSQDPQPWLESVINDGMDFASRIDLRLALERSPLFLEHVDVLKLYHRLFSGGHSQAVDRAAQCVLDQCSGQSLDAAMSETVTAGDLCVPDPIVDSRDL